MCANEYYKLDHGFFQTKFESQIIKLIYKNYWVDTLSANAILVNENYYIQQIDDMSKKISHFNVRYIFIMSHVFRKNLHSSENKDINEAHQRKVDEIKELNVQASLNMQNEIMKNIIFKD